jgi:hypothetical protein
VRSSFIERNAEYLALRQHLEAINHVFPFSEYRNTEVEVSLSHQKVDQIKLSSIRVDEDIRAFLQPPVVED